MEFKHKYCLGERVYCDDGKVGVIGIVKEIYANIYSSTILYNISDVISNKSYYYKEEDISRDDVGFFLLLSLRIVKQCKEFLQKKITDKNS